MLLISTAVLAVTAFAANSILCRLALGRQDIDPAGFTAVRLTSGAVMLAFITLTLGRTRETRSKGSWTSAAALFLYAVMFSFAYLRLDVAAGALILFAAVQVTMILSGLARGERPRPLHWLGLGTALAGLLVLLSPGLTAPSMAGSTMMAAAGVAWGAYSLRGRGSGDPLGMTAGNFFRSVPMVLAVAAVSCEGVRLSSGGVMLAAASGALASGAGYVLWYATLRRISATRAACMQLTVPVIAAIGGIVFLGESISLRLALSGPIILGGVALTFVGRERRIGSGRDSIRPISD